MWEWLQTLFLFSLVLVLAWLTTRLLGYKSFGAMRGRMVRVLEHVPAGRDRSILLLEVGGRLYLVGATAEQISLLDAIEDPAAIEQIMAQVPSGAAAPLGVALPETFRETLQRLRGAPQGGSTTGAEQRPHAGAPPSPDNSAEIQRLEQQLERLRRLQGK